MECNDLSPIVLFVYNRPFHTKQTILALKQNELADSSDLIIYSDGPKNEKSVQKVKEVREYIKTVTGFKSILIHKSEKNNGLANSIIKGITKTLSTYAKTIVLEDDLITSRHFLQYMNEALLQYENEEKVMQVSGFSFSNDISFENDSFFLSFTTSWGWATWKRAWEYFDPSMKGYELVKRDKKLRDRFNLNGAYNYFNLLELYKKGKIDSWAIRWYLSVFLHNGLTLYPKKTMVANIGFDGSGANCGGLNTGDIQAAIEPFEVKGYPKKIEQFGNEGKIYPVIRGRSNSFRSLGRGLYAIVKKML